MGHDSEHQINLEYRALVIKKLDSLEEGMGDLRSDITLIKTSFAQQAELKELRLRVEALDLFKSKVIGGFIAFQIILSGIGYLLNKILS